MAETSLAVARTVEPSIGPPTCPEGRHAQAQSGEEAEMTGRTTGTARGVTRSPTTRRTGLVAVGTAALLTLAACGSGGSQDSKSAAAAGSGSDAAQQSAHPGKIATQSTNLGRVMVDPRGRTLYAFAADAPHHSARTRSRLPPPGPVPASPPGRRCPAPTRPRWPAAA